MNSSSKEFDPVLDYAVKACGGVFPVSRWVKLACERHIRDVERNGVDLVWDLPEVLKIFRFFSNVLCLNGGQFEGKPFNLLPFEQFIVGSVFGWKLPNGTRRYQESYCEIGKGNGKSPLAAGVGMAGLIVDHEPRAEIYAAATKHDQAMVLFRDAVAMRDQSPQLRQRLKKSGVGEKCWNLAYPALGAWFRPISSDDNSQSGPRPHMALVDEIHEHKTDVVIVMLRQGFKWRRNPLLFMITNSGFDRESVCYHYHDYVCRILKGQTDLSGGDRLFGFIGALDSCEKHWLEGQEQPVDGCAECDNWSLEGDHWYKANPALDAIQPRQKLRDEVAKAIDIPAEENRVRRLNFCYWTNQATRWLSLQAWDECAGSIDFEKLRGRSCIVGLDLANKEDIAALVLLFPPERLAFKAEPPVIVRDGDGESDPVSYSFIEIDKLADEFIVVPYFFIPRDTIAERVRRDGVPYDVWVREGLIDSIDGAVIDYQAIKRKIAGLKDIYPIKTIYDKGVYHLIGVDPWNATEFINDMATTHGLRMIEVRQGFQTMSEPTKEMSRLIKAKKVRHGGNPVLRWMASNVEVRSDPAGNIKPVKPPFQQVKSKIDGIVALIIALAVAIRTGANRGQSVYEERGIRML